jgi:hypothetical protein
MPGAGRSESAAVRAIGATVALVAVVGYLVFGWSFGGSNATTPTVIGIIVAASVIGWALYSRLFADDES